MTERELRNAEWKERIRRDAEDHCRFIDLMETELKQKEIMNKSLSEHVDTLCRKNEELLDEKHGLTTA